MVKGLLNKSIRFYESNPSGRILNRASRDQQIIDEILPTTMFDCIQSLLMTIGSIFIIGIINPWIFLILVPFVGIALLLRHIYMCTNCQLKHLENITRSPVCSLFTTSLNGMMTIRALKIEDYFIQLLLNRIDANTRANLSLIGVSCWFGLLVDLLNSFFLLIVILMSVILKDKIDSSLIVLLLVYMITIKGYFQWSLRQAVETQILMTSAERIYEYGRFPCEEDLRDEHQYIRTPPDWPNRGSIEFRNYSFRYPTNARYALQNFNIHIEPNEKIGIIGRTGTGKSSLFQALFRFIDQSLIRGHILIDDIDISRISLKRLRSCLSIIPQQSVLFSGTVRSNLDPLNTYSDEECWEALEDVQLKMFVASHSDGLLLPVTQSGVNFSAGQRELICATRAILRHSKILLVDEATANFDLQTDRIIQQLFACRFQNRTVLTIVHRLDTVMQSDRILVLNKGQVENFNVSESILHYYQ